MVKEEQIIGGVLCHRFSNELDEKEWIHYNYYELTEMIVRLRGEVSALNFQLEEALSNNNDRNNSLR